MASATSSSGMITNARGFKLTHEAVLQSYVSKVLTEWAKYSLPATNEKVTWTVYKLSPSGLFTHYSLLFVCEDTAYSGSPGFTFELVCAVGEPSGDYVTPHTAFKQRGSGTKLGVISHGSAGAIMNKGLQCLANFGDYHTVTNNCQKFCSKLAGELGISQPWTDGDTAAALTVGGFVLGGGAIVYQAISTLFSSPSDDQQREQERRRR